MNLVNITRGNSIKQGVTGWNKSISQTHSASDTGYTYDLHVVWTVAILQCICLVIICIMYRRFPLCFPANRLNCCLILTGILNIENRF